MLIPRYRPNFPAGHLGWFIAACVFFTVGMLGTVFFVAKESEHEAGARRTATDTDPRSRAAARADGDGRRRQRPRRQGDLHDELCELPHAGRCGDDRHRRPQPRPAQPDEALVVEKGHKRPGRHAAFEGVLTEEEITEVAAYVSAAAGT